MIFTDLDGTLLDLENYSFKPAEAALRRIQAAAIPLIFCSSKTRSEQRYYQQQMGIRAPMIVENGAAIIIPAGYFSPVSPHNESDEVIELGVSANLIRTELSRIRADMHLAFRGYTELSLGELCHWTGLNRDAALRAQQREYSEILLGELTAGKVVALNTALQKIGLVAIRGSRFYTVTSTCSNKGMAAAGLRELFLHRFGEVKTVGLGDSASDLPLLRVVDHAFMLRQPATVAMMRHFDWLTVTGPAAWAKIVHRLLDEHLPKG